jgi:hypothetical protein
MLDVATRHYARVFLGGRIREMEGADAGREPCASAIRKAKVRDNGVKEGGRVKGGKRSRRRQHVSVPRVQGRTGRVLWVSAGLAAGLGRKARPEQRNTTSTTTIDVCYGYSWPGYLRVRSSPPY